MSPMVILSIVLFVIGMINIFIMPRYYERRYKEPLNKSENELPETKDADVNLGKQETTSKIPLLLLTWAVV